MASAQQYQQMPQAVSPVPSTMTMVARAQFADPKRKPTEHKPDEHTQDVQLAEDAKQQAGAEGGMQTNMNPPPEAAYVQATVVVPNVPRADGESGQQAKEGAVPEGEGEFGGAPMNTPGVVF